MTALLSVVIPAHNEGRVIERLLRQLVDSAGDRLEIVVVANGCTDDTAAIARAVDPRIRVIELEQGSKVAALNAGDDAAVAFPRAYVDADVEVDAAALLALADALSGPEPRIASPALRLDLSGVSTGVRAYYSVWELSTFRQRGHIGSGIYAMSAEGRARFGRFPDLIGDDRFVQGLFEPHERTTLTEHHFTIRPPRTLDALVHRGGRIAAGNQQLKRAGLEGAAPSAGSSLSQLVKRILPRPPLWPAFVLYCVVQLRTRRLAERKLASASAPVWDRDETSRV